MKNEQKISIGYIGTGLMGEPMAHHLLDKYHSIYVWNRTSEKATNLLRSGAIWADSPKSLAKKTNIIILCLTDADACREVIFGTNGVVECNEPKIIIDHSTISPDEAKKISIDLETYDTSYIDAPVTGSVPGAINGTLVVFASGPVSVYNVIKPVLDTYSSKVTHFGDNPLGQVAKLCNQIMLHNTIIATYETLEFAELQGLDPFLLTSSLEGSLIDSKAWQIFSKSILEPYDTKLAHIKDMMKDLTYVKSFMSDNLPVTNSVIKKVSDAVDNGFGMDCVSKLYRKVR